MADRSPDRSWYRLRWSRPAPDLRAVRLECKRCAMLRYSSSNPAPAVALGTPSVSNLVVIPVPPSPSPSLTDVLVRARRPLGLNLLPRIEPKPRPDVDAVKILRDAAKQRRKNGEKFSTMLPDEILKQQLKHLFGESDSQGSDPDGAGGGVLGAPPRPPPPTSTQPRVEPAARPSPPANRADRIPGAPEPASSSPPAVRVQPEPARRLRYVVPPRDADKENADKEKAPRDKDGTRGSKPRSKFGSKPDPNQRTLSQAFRGDGAANGGGDGDAETGGDGEARRAAAARWTDPTPRDARSRAGAPDARAPASKRVRRAKAPAAAPAAATSGGNRRRRLETLRFTDAAKDTRDAAVLAEFEAASAEAAACAVGVLTVDLVGDASFGHRSNLRPESYSYDKIGGKDAGDEVKRAAKEWLDALPAGHPRRDAGWSGAIERRAVAFGVVFLGRGIREVAGSNPAGGAMYVFRVDASDGCIETREQSDALVRAVGFHKRAVQPGGHATTTTTDGPGAGDSPPTTTDGGGWVGPRPVVVHHAQAVTRALAEAGARVDPHALEVMDTRCMAWLAAPDDAHEGGIAAVSSRLHHPGDGSNLGDTTNAFDRAGAGDETNDDVLGGFRADILASASLAQRLRATAGLDPNVVRTEGKVAAALGQMEHVGLGFDPSAVRAAVGDLRRKLAGIESAAAASMPDGARVNLGSPQQVAEALYNTLKLPPPSSNAQQGAKTAQLTTKDDALRSLRDKRLHPLPGLVLEYRAVSRAIAMCNSYASLARGKRLRCDWNNTRTATGRLSSSNPNLQAVGKDETGEFSLRRAFSAPPGKVLLAADYSQIELRMLAHLAGDRGLVALLRRQITDGGDVFERIWNAGRGAPPETPVAKEDRDRAKRTVYGLLYGQGKTGLAEKLGCTGDVAQGLINAFFRAFPGVRAFVTRTKERARVEKKVVLPSGRHRPLPGFASDDRRERAESERKAVNSLIQGSASDLMKIAMCRWLAAASPVGIEPATTEHADVASTAATLPARLVAQIHDELLFECEDSPTAVRAAARVVAACMERAVPQLAVPTPAKVSVGRTWAELEPLGEWLARRSGVLGGTLGGDPD